MDGNFQVEHMRMSNPENDVMISDGTGFMVSKKAYELHLKSAAERQQVSPIIMRSESTRLNSSHAIPSRMPSSA